MKYAKEKKLIQYVYNQTIAPIYEKISYDINIDNFSVTELENIQENDAFDVAEKKGRYYYSEFVNSTFPNSQGVKYTCGKYDRIDAIQYNTENKPIAVELKVRKNKFFYENSDSTLMIQHHKLIEMNHLNGTFGKIYANISEDGNVIFLYNVEKVIEKIRKNEIAVDTNFSAKTTAVESAKKLKICYYLPFSMAHIFIKNGEKYEKISVEKYNEIIKNKIIK